MNAKTCSLFELLYKPKLNYESNFDVGSSKKLKVTSSKYPNI